jgi:DNA-directed RNA polymerase specialized sigma24 family protein
VLTERQRELYDYAEANPHLNQTDLAVRFGIRRESVNRLLSRARHRLDPYSSVPARPFRTVRVRRLGSVVV